MRNKTAILTGTILGCVMLPLCHCLSQSEAQETETVDGVVALIEQAAEEAGIDPSDVVLVPPPDEESGEAEYFTALGEWVSACLEADGANYRLNEIHTFGTGENQDTMGRRILFGNQGEQIPSRFVPHDPRRIGWSGNSSDGTDDITSFIDDLFDGHTNSGLTRADTTPAISRAMETWNNVQSTVLPINQQGVFGPTSTSLVPLGYVLDFGVIENLRGYGGHPYLVAADIEHCGFVPGGFFGPGSNSVLAATFIISSIDDDGVKTDIDNDGYYDTRWCEIYYNDNFVWKIDTEAFPYVFEYDVETTALHEAGHALSLPHFGHGFQTLKNYKVHYAPRAVMNSSYTGLLHEPTGRDIGLFESLWATWPRQ